MDKNVVIDKMKDLAISSKEAAVAIKNLNRAMDIFCEKMNMDMDEFKQQMVLKALKDGADGKERDYLGNLDADAADVIEKLVKERDSALSLLKKQEELNDKFYRQNEELYKNSADCLKILNHLKFGSVHINYEIKKKYTFNEVVDLLEELGSEYRKEIIEADKVLTANVSDNVCVKQSRLHKNLFSAC